MKVKNNKLFCVLNGSLRLSTLNEVQTMSA